MPQYVHRNQQKLYPRIPIVVAELLQYSGLEVELKGWVFFMLNESQLIEIGVSILDLGVLVKIMRVDG